ncbi:hypothetical protein ACFRAM_03240 [Paenibacillus sp. NPDC056722]|uniref:hypothetical protein n=1 Tax=Paenibacillus sp. NPDC056722 TaxID=3345924 RepID=UPI003676F006
MNKKYLLGIAALLAVMFIFSTYSHKREPSNDNVISLHKLHTLAQKGEHLTWSDFEGYPFEDIGSGLYIRKYEVEGGSHLLLSGGSTDLAPMSINLVKTNGERIAIRYEEING